jgi:hypothetical protein
MFHRVKYPCIFLCALAAASHVLLGLVGCTESRAEPESARADALTVHHDSVVLTGGDREQKLALVREANQGWLHRGRGECKYDLCYFRPVPYPQLGAYFPPKDYSPVRAHISGPYDRGVGFYPASEFLLYSSGLPEAELLRLEYKVVGVDWIRKALVLFGEFPKGQMEHALDCAPVFPANLPPRNREDAEKRKAKLEDKARRLGGSFALVFNDETGYLERECYWLWQSEEPNSQFSLAADKLEQSLVDCLSNGVFPGADIEIMYTRDWGALWPTRIALIDAANHRRGFLHMDVDSGLWFLSNAIWIQEYGGTGTATSALAMQAQNIQVASGD